MVGVVGFEDKVEVSGGGVEGSGRVEELFDEFKVLESSVSEMNFNEGISGE